MFNWLLTEALGWVIALVGFALVWPIYKSGFLVRQGLVYIKGLSKVDAAISNAQTSGNTFSPNDEYYALKRKALAMMVLPVLALSIVALILIVFASWKIAAILLAIAVVGFVNVN